MTMRVLVVDDSEIFGYFATTALSDAGMQVEIATTLTVARAAVQAHRPDVIVVDLLIGEERGDDYCRDLRADPMLQGIPLILISARPMDELEGLGRDADVDATMQKSSDADALVELIRTTAHAREHSH